MPKGRIGLSLDEDVLAILNEYGRRETGYLDRAEFEAQRRRPTRTEIIQTAIREWAARQKET